MIDASAGRRTRYWRYRGNSERGIDVSIIVRACTSLLGAAGRRTDSRASRAAAHRDVRTARMLVRVVSVRFATAADRAGTDRPAGRRAGSLIVVARSGRRVARSLLRPHLGPIRPFPGIADGRGRLLAGEPRGGDLHGGSGGRADRRGPDRRQRRIHAVVERGSAGCELGDLRRQLAGRAEPRPTTRPERSRIPGYTQPPTQGRKTTAASDTATRTGRPRVTTRARERDAKTHCVAPMARVPAQTSQSEVRPARIVAATRTRCHVPWTREVGIDARGAVRPSTSVRGRW